jgi:DNA-binding transcriptional LysR family regulator
VTQSTISQNVQSLERELGVTLFQRTARGMTLTSAGHALLGPTRRILRDVRQAEAALSADPRRRTPRLDVAVLSPALNGPLAAVLAGFVAESPGTIVQVHELESEQAAPEVIASGRAEVVATRLPLDVGRGGDGLETMPLGAYNVYVAYPPGHHPAPGSALDGAGEHTVDIHGIHDVPLVLMPSRPVLSASVQSMFDENRPQLRRRAVVGRRETRTAWMLEGIAATLLGSRPARQAERRGARVVPLDGASDLRIGLAWDPRTVSPVGRRFIAAAAAAAPRSTTGHEPQEPGPPGAEPHPHGGSAEDRAT